MPYGDRDSFGVVVGLGQFGFHYFGVGWVSSTCARALLWLAGSPSLLSSYLSLSIHTAHVAMTVRGEEGGEGRDWRRKEGASRHFSGLCILSFALAR